MARLFDRDELTGTTTWFQADETGDGFSLHTEQDVSPLLDLTKRAYNDNTGGYRGDVHHVASLPLNVWWDLKQKGIIDDPKAFKRWLNASENRFFRVKPGKV